MLINVTFYSMLVMRVMQYFRAMYTRQPATLEEYEEFARLSLLSDIYGFYASGSIIGPQCTLQENITAYTRFDDHIVTFKVQTRFHPLQIFQFGWKRAWHFHAQSPLPI